MTAEKTLSRKKIYEGRIFDLEEVTVELSDGKTAYRDIIRHPGACAVLPIENDGRIHMVRQYRKPLDEFSLEIPAGRLDPGETPIQCATRELSEETGLRADSMTHVMSLATTPAFCDEIIHIFIATGLSLGETDFDDDEFLESELIHIDDIIKLIVKGELNDSKTIAAVYHAKLKLGGILPENPVQNGESK